MNELEIKKTELVAESTTPEVTKRTRAPRKKAASTAVEVQQTQPILPRDIPFIDPKEARRRENKERWMKERERKSKMVTGKFLFNECPGGELTFYFREFPGETLKKYTMRHDSIHTIPLGVAIHLNDNCAYVEYQHNLDGGKAVDIKNMYIQSKVHRTNFIPMDWSIDAGNSSGRSIAQVSFTNPLDSRFNLDATGR